MTVKIDREGSIHPDTRRVMNAILLAAAKAADANSKTAAMVGIGIVVAGPGGWVSRIVVPEGAGILIGDEGKKNLRKPLPGELPVAVARHFKLFVEETLAKCQRQAWYGRPAYESRPPGSGSLPPGIAKLRRRLHSDGSSPSGGRGSDGVDPAASADAGTQAEEEVKAPGQDPALRDFDRRWTEETALFEQLGLADAHKRLRDHYETACETEDFSDFDACQEFQKRHGMLGAEIFFVPDNRWYKEILATSYVHPKAVLLDAGAGDLRFSLALAKRVRKVYAVEINPTVLGPALATIGYDLPTNLVPICADVWDLPLPKDVTAVISIMRHRAHDFPRMWGRTPVAYVNHEGLKFLHEGLGTV